MGRCVAALIVILLALPVGSSRLAGQSAIAPSGTLRAAFIAGNPAMAVKNPATGELGGPAVDLARELARQRGVGVALVGVQNVEVGAAGDTSRRTFHPGWR